MRLIEPDAGAQFTGRQVSRWNFLCTGLQTHPPHYYAGAMQRYFQAIGAD